MKLDLRPAPADKGTELAVTGDDHDAIRTALRETKALLEVGEVAQPVAEGSAEPTPLNAPLRAADAHAKGRGPAVKAVTWEGVNEIGSARSPTPGSRTPAT